MLLMYLFHGQSVQQCSNLWSDNLKFETRFYDKYYNSRPRPRPISRKFVTRWLIRLKKPTKIVLENQLHYIDICNEFVTRMKISNLYDLA